MNKAMPHRCIKKAHAKINLSLDVTGKRADGYHLLDSIMQTVDIYDSIYLEKTEATTVTLQVDDLRSQAATYADFGSLSKIPLDRSNLMVKAAEMMRLSFPGISGIHMELKKKIPVEAGLGGGSSDAAEVIKGMNELFNLGLGPTVLEEMAVAIGADVPFFIRGGTQRVRGIGERLDVLSPAEKHPSFPGFVLILKPYIKSSTPQVYAAYDKIIGLKEVKIRHPNIEKQVAFLKQTGTGAKNNRVFLNEAENVLFHAIPPKSRDLLSRIKALMMDLEAKKACMSGSGTAVFGLFSGKEVLQRAARIVREHPLSGQISDILETRICSY